MKRISIIAVALVAAGCGAPQPGPRSVAQLKAEPMVLQGLLARCAADKRAAARDVECSNARVALEQLGAIADRAQSGERGVEFDRKRELRRQRDEQLRPVDANKPFDPYSSPVSSDPPQATDAKR